MYCGLDCLSVSFTIHYGVSIYNLCAFPNILNFSKYMSVYRSVLNMSLVSYSLIFISSCTIFVVNVWCLSPRFCTIRQGTPWTDEMNFLTNHAPCAGSIAWSVDQQSSELPLVLFPPPHICYNCEITYLDKYDETLECYDFAHWMLCALMGKQS